MSLFAAHTFGRRDLLQCHERANWVTPDRSPRHDHFSVDTWEVVSVSIDRFSCSCAHWGHSADDCEERATERPSRMAVLRLNDAVVLCSNSQWPFCPVAMAIDHLPLSLTWAALIKLVCYFLSLSFHYLALEWGQRSIVSVSGGDAQNTIECPVYGL